MLFNWSFQFFRHLPKHFINLGISFVLRKGEFCESHQHIKIKIRRYKRAKKLKCFQTNNTPKKNLIIGGMIEIN